MYSPRKLESELFKVLLGNNILTFGVVYSVKIIIIIFYQSIGLMSTKLTCNLGPYQLQTAHQTGFICLY